MLRTFNQLYNHLNNSIIMKNTRIITITRPKWVEDKKNPGQMKKVYVSYPCRVNRAVADDNRICENW
jgi:hypothetical protein